MTTIVGNVVPLRPAEPADGSALREATMVAFSAAGLELELDGGRQIARVAFSCLVRPEPGDRCLCARLEGGDYCVLGIIERPRGRDMTLAFPGDATLSSPHGIALAAGQSVSIASAGALTCVSDRAVHQCREAVVDYHGVVARGEELKATFSTVTLIGRTVSTIARQAVQRFWGYIRQTEETDQVSAGQITRRAEGLYSMDSKYAMMVSKKDTKIDAERIFMG